MTLIWSKVYSRLLSLIKNIMFPQLYFYFFSRLYYINWSKQCSKHMYISKISSKYLLIVIYIGWKITLDYNVFRQFIIFYVTLPKDQWINAGLVTILVIYLFLSHFVWHFLLMTKWSFPKPQSWKDLGRYQMVESKTKKSWQSVWIGWKPSRLNISGKNIRSFV